MLLWVALALGAEPLRLDAGSWSSPVLQDFERLHAEGCDDPRAHWERPPRATSVSNDPDPLAMDHLDGGALRLDLDPGPWVMWVMLGTAKEDPRAWAGVDGFGIRVDGGPALEVPLAADWPAFLESEHFAADPRPSFDEGGSAWRRQVAPASPWRRVEVRVGEDGVLVEPFGRPLQALVAWPAAREIEGEVDLVVVDAFRQAWWARHVVGATVAEAEAPAVTAGSLTARLGWLEDPTGPEATSTVHLARSDRASRAVVLSGTDAPGTVTVSAPPGLSVDVAEASWLDAAGHPDRMLRPRPTVLWPGGSWRGGQGAPPVLAVTLRSDGELPPGRYQVTLDVAVQEQHTTLDLQVVLHDVRLQPRLHAGLFTQVPPEATLRTGFASDTVLDLVEQQLTLLADHGLDTLSVRYAFWPDHFPQDDVVDDRVWTHAATTWASLGGHALVWADPKVPLRPSAYGDLDGPVLLAERVASTTALLRLAAASPVPVWLHIWEEEAGWKDLATVPRGRALAARLRHLGVPPPPMLGALATPADWAVADAMDVALVTGRGDLLLAGLAHARTAGATPWAYNLAPGACGPLLAWAAGAEGLLQWHANPRSSDPFHAVQRKPRWFHTVLGPDGRVHGTTQLADLSDGVADAHLWDTVDARILGRRGAAARALREARDAFADQLLAARPSPGNDGVLVPANVRDAVRTTILTLLERVPE